MTKILVVEDSKSIREEICDILQFENFEVIFAENGAQGLEQAKKELPNLIISDISMPKLNGYQFLAELQKSSVTESIPFIFLSGKAELLDLRKGMNMGADDYLIKPFNTDELIKVVKGKLKKQQLIKENINKLVEENEFLLKEAGRMAKIGYWIYDKQTDIISWSKAVHKIYGTDPKEGMPEPHVILNCFNKQSRQQLAKATLEIVTNGVSFDIELQMTNLKNEKRWIQDIGEPLYNDKNQIVGSRGIIRDITDLKNDQEELKQSKRELEASLKIVKRSEFLFKQAGRLTKVGAYELFTKEDNLYWTEEMFTIFGLKQNSKPLLQPLFNLCSGESRSKIRAAIENIEIKGIPYDLELDLINFKKEHIWVRVLGEPIFNENTEVIGRRGVVQDITDIKRSQIELELSKQKIQTSLELVKENEYSLKEAGRMAKIGYWNYKKETDIIFWSDAVHEIYGSNPNDGVPDLDVILTCFNQKSRKQLVEATIMLAVKGAHFDIELEMTNLKNEKRWIRNIGEPIYNDQKEIIGRRGVSQDITQWMLAGQEIQEYQTSLQKLTTEITLIEEKQKKEIASNIHDHLSQSLVISKMRINELKKKPQLKEIDKDLKFIETHISEALENSRKITYELSPPVLYQLGIIDAVSWLLEDVEATHKVKCLLNCSAADIKLSDVKSILLYRSIQEVINNAIKYAKASLITLDFDENNFGIDIFITDNGVGFNTSVLNNLHNHSGSGFGLFTVQERIRNIQGEFNIVSEKNRGTTVKIFIPLTK
jgi:PAS domain S-box-containing protein